MTFVGDLLVEVKDKPGHGTELPVLTLTERNGFVLQSDRFSKRIATEDTSGYKLVCRNDIAFNPYLLWAGAVAQNTIVDAGITSPLYPTFRVRDGHDPRYVARLLLTPRLIGAYDTIAFGSVPRRRRSSVRDFLALEVDDVPALDRQRRVADILDRGDALRAQRRRVLEQLRAFTRSIFLDMFSSVESGATVEGVAADRKGSIRTGPFGSQLLHSEFVDEGISVLGLDNVVSGEFRWAERRFVTPEKYKQLKRYTVYPGDVLVSIMGTTGRCVVVPDGIPTAINTKHICAISVDPDRALPEFVRAAFLWHPVSFRYVRQQTKGAIMDGLNMGIVRKTPLPLPDLPRQREFVERARSVGRQADAAEYALALHDKLFASLQSRAFSGEL